MTEEMRDHLKEMEGDYTELRLAEHAFFRELIKGIKEKHRRIIFWIVIFAVIFLVAWNCISCPWLHRIGIGFCPMRH